MTRRTESRGEKPGCVSRKQTPWKPRERGKAEPARRSLGPPGVAEWGGRKAERFRRAPVPPRGLARTRKDPHWWWAVHPHPGPMTRTPSRARPAAGLCLRQIPFAAAAQVPQEREGRCVSLRLRPLSGVVHPLNPTISIHNGQGRGLPRPATRLTCVTSLSAMSIFHWRPTGLGSLE